MTGRVVMGAAHDRPVLHHASEAGQVLPDANAWARGRNLLESTSHAGGSVRFHIEGVQMTEASPSKERNA